MIFTPSPDARATIINQRIANRILPKNMPNDRIPLSPEAIRMVQDIQAELRLPSNEAATLINIMWEMKANGGRLFGAPYEAYLDLAPMDPREALDIAGTALLSAPAARRPGGPWQIRRKIHPDPICAGGFRFLAQISYVWYPKAPNFQLSTGTVEAHGAARLSADNSQLMLDLMFQDEWGWIFPVSQQHATNAWNTVMTELGQQGLVTNVAQRPLWPITTAETPRVPMLAARPYAFQASNLSEQGKHAEALAIYNQALQLDPYNPGSLGGRAACHYFLGDLENAIRDATSAMRMAPTDPSNYAIRAIFFRNAGYLDHALTDAERCVRLNPADAGAYATRALLLKDLGRTDEARGDFQKALQLDPGNAQAQQGLLAIEG